MRHFDLKNVICSCPFLYCCGSLSLCNALCVFFSQEKYKKVEILSIEAQRLRFLKLSKSDADKNHPVKVIRDYICNDTETIEGIYLILNKYLQNIFEIMRIFFQLCSLNLWVEVMSDPRFPDTFQLPTG